MLRLTKDYIITGTLSFPKVYEIVAGLIEGKFTQLAVVGETLAYNNDRGALFLQLQYPLTHGTRPRGSSLELHTPSQRLKL
jgi:hypothetical protein